MKIKADMSGKGLTIYAGLLPVLNFMKKLNFRGMIEKGVTIERAVNAVYQFVDAVQMIVIGVIAGATGMNHVTVICSDEVIKQMAGWEDVPVATTLKRIMGLVKLSNVVELEVLIHKIRGRIWKSAVRAGQKLRSALSVMWLDVDSTVSGVYGNQEGAEKGYNPKKKGQKSYHPLMAFVSETKEVLHSWFRCGSAYTGNGIVEFMKECVARIKRGIRVIVRADSGFFSGELLEYLESVQAGYLIKVKMRNLVGLLGRQVWTAVAKYSEWEEAVFYHKCIGWSHSRKFVAVKRLIRIEKGLFDLPVYEYFCYVTTEAFSPMEVHKKYGERATCETWIEECKNQMGAAYIRTSDFLTNSALFQCAVLAYNMLKWMGLLTGGEIKKWEVKTIRMYLIRVAGKLIKKGRQLILNLPERFLYQDKWKEWELMSLTCSLD